MEKSKCIIFDLDWTLCELRDKPYNHDGEEYLISDMHKIWVWVRFTCDTRIILTGRKRKEYGEITKKYLMDNDIFYKELIMQEWNTWEKDYIFKKKELIKLQERFDIVAMFDDNPDMIQVCKELWITLLHVNR
jgi:FMN phosphatase YigB (HAD superfamily)